MVNVCCKVTGVDVNDLSHMYQVRGAQKAQVTFVWFLFLYEYYGLLSVRQIAPCYYSIVLLVVGS